jgi:hypothetical protein
MEFEAAGVLKSRLDRIAELDAARYAHVRDAQGFRFVIIQRGPSSHQACTFVCDRGELAAGPIVDFPPVESQMTAVLTACDRLADTREGSPTEADRRRMGIVAWYLFSGKAGDGLVLPRRSVTADAACRLLEAVAADLRLRPPKRLSADGAATSSGPDVPPAPPGMEHR